MLIYDEDNICHHSALHGKADLYYSLIHYHWYTSVYQTLYSSSFLHKKRLSETPAISSSGGRVSTYLRRVGELRRFKGLCKVHLALVSTFSIARSMSALLSPKFGRKNTYWRMFTQGTGRTAETSTTRHI